MRRPNWTTYSLKEYQDARNAFENERRRETLVFVGLIFGAFWHEIQRRLLTLNHAHEQAVEVQHTYVTDDKFSDFVDRYEENRGFVAKALTLAEGKDQGSTRSWGAIVAGLTLLLAATAITVTLVVAAVTVAVILLTK